MQQLHPRSLRIGIDCRLAGARHAGIGRYIENLITRLPRLLDQKPVRWVLFFHNREQVRAIFSKVPDHYEILYAPVRHYTIAEQLFMPIAFSRAQLDLLHVPHFNIPLLYRGTIVMTIHDLLWHEYKGTAVTTLPAWQYWIKHRLYVMLTGIAVRRAALIFTPTMTVCQTIQHFYPATEKKCQVSFEGIGEVFRSFQPTKSRGRYQRRLVYVGSLYPHKNVRVIFEALRHLPDHTLSIVGTRTVFQDTTQQLAQQLGVIDRVTFLGYLPDAQLAAYLHESGALIQPSLSEGFGLTGVEALAVGARVVASDIPVFREVYQDVAKYFDPHQAHTLVDKILEIEKATGVPSDSTIKKVLARYDWQRMVRETVEGYVLVLTPSIIP